MHAKDGRQRGHTPFDLRRAVQNLVPELVPISAHLTAFRGTEAGPKPRFRPQMDLS
jgi:hypothetical protein